MDPHFDGVIFQTHAAELKRRLARHHPPFAVLDVRPAADYARGHIPGARSVDAGPLTAFPPGTDAGTEFFIVGRDPADPNVRAASLALKRLGAHRPVEFPGGMLEWFQEGHAVEGSRAAAA